MAETVETPVAEGFLEALSGDQRASVEYANLSPSCKREYLNWITSTKRPETRAKRIAAALASIASKKTA